MFDLALFDYIKDNFTVGGKAVRIGFGDIKDTKTSPYLIQFSLDNDKDRQFLCSDYNDDGVAFIQWNIFDSKPSVGVVIQDELEEFLDNIWKNNISLTYDGKIYNIKTREHNSSPSAQELGNDLGVTVLANTFNYEKE